METNLKKPRFLNAGFYPSQQSGELLLRSWEDKGSPQ